MVLLILIQDHINHGLPRLTKEFFNASAEFFGRNMFFVCTDDDSDVGKGLFERTFVFFPKWTERFDAIRKMDRINTEFGQRADPSDQFVRASKRRAAGTIYDPGQGELFFPGIFGEGPFSLSEIREAAYRRAAKVLRSV
jgi:hypothetical protein